MYSIDTSSILTGWRRTYPPDVFPPLWEKLDDLIKKGDLIATEEVLHELERKDDEVYDWALGRRDMFIEIDDEIQVVVQQILRDHKKLLDTRKGRSGADSFVIALAKIRGCDVVTNEHPTNSPDRPHIPDVCRSLGIRTVTLLELIREQGWVFRTIA
jgi:hypothetical protein